jgi:hypothetical protein
MLSVINCFLSLKIPEEHDLESQIRKEREWRFLRNTRVRKQAQQVIQKGKDGAPGALHSGQAPAKHMCNPRALCVLPDKDIKLAEMKLGCEIVHPLTES